MKVIRTDNYNRERVAESLVADNLNDSDAIEMCRSLNEDPNRYDCAWHVVKPDSYRLWRGMEDLI